MKNLQKNGLKPDYLQLLEETEDLKASYKEDMIFGGLGGPTVTMRSSTNCIIKTKQLNKKNFTRYRG
ncbi:hypothetical protein AB3331_04835 [Streptococcus sp. H49]|uniref:hypothetical protein n=1 Tax=Streptococcus huangxiaojuni TaxID=3237239 RepID=UPI0034A50550